MTSAAPPTAPNLWTDEGKTVRHPRETYFTATRRLQQRGSERIVDSYGDELWRQIDQRLHGWGFAKMHAQIRYKALENGIRVETVNPAYTSKTCHCCGEQGYRPKQATFTCTNAECWVSEHQADVNAALNIADRYLSGESHSGEHADGDDSAEDGGPLTAPQDSQADAETQQTTRGPYAS